VAGIGDPFQVQIGNRNLEKAGDHQRIAVRQSYDGVDPNLIRIVWVFVGLPGLEQIFNFPARFRHRGKRKQDACFVVRVDYKDLFAAGGAFSVVIGKGQGNPVGTLPGIIV
jgi:hypothetical protein